MSAASQRPRLSSRSATHDRSPNSSLAGSGKPVARATASLYRPERQPADDEALAEEHQQHRGIVEITDAAAICACCTSYCCAKRAIATGTVAVSRDVRMSAIGNSFQLKMNARMPAAISPGTASGSDDAQERLQRPAAVDARGLLDLRRDLAEERASSATPSSAG